jgi:polysaccharide pyruvyl transferase CsaB
MTRPQIFIVGYYGFRNLGDEAVLSAMLSGLRGRLDDPLFTVSSGDPEQTTSDHGVAAVQWQDVSSMVGAIRTSDLVIIGGGGLFHDYWGVNPESVLSKQHYGISYCATPAVLAALRRAPLMIYGVGVGPLLSDDARGMTRAVFDLAAVATVRDAESRGELEKLGVEADRVEVTADPAFGLPSPTVSDIAAAEAQIGGPGKGPLLGVCLRGWNVDTDESVLMQAVAGALDGFVEAHNAQVILVPFSDLDEELTDDTRVAEKLTGMIRAYDRVTVCSVPATPVAARALLSRCSLVLGMRLHSLLFAATEGVPMVALAYDPKVTHLMTALDAEGWCLDLPDASAHTIRDRLEDAFGRRKENGRRLKVAAGTLAARAARSADLAAGLINGSVAVPNEHSREARDFLQAAIERAVIRGEEKATTAEKLVIQRDWLQGQQGMLIAQRDAALAERDAVSAQRNAVSAQRDAVSAQRDALIRERIELVEQRKRFEAQLSDLETRQEEQTEILLATEFQLQQITGTRSFGAISAWWKLRERLNHALRAAGRSVIPRSLRQRMTNRRSTSGLLPGMNWYAYAFDRFKRARAATLGSGVRGVESPGVPGLVSIVLPVYNGADMVRESLDSLLSQTYTEFEIIAINDGSSDDTGAILDKYAKRDDRVRVVHQENRKLPLTLSRGFRMARGEFLTWTSADNRCQPAFLESLVDSLRKHPGWDMVYANPDIIGDDGRPLRESQWYSGYQVPAGSEHIHLPTDPSELNVYPNNYVGAAFMYRSRVAWLLGDYSGRRFTTEDYDYWMRVNEFLTLRHADFDDTIYDYRFHASSLTARDEELGITRGRVQLMVFDDFRRDVLLAPALWHVDHVGDGAGARAEALRRRVEAAGHLLFDTGTGDLESWPRLFLTAIAVRIVAGNAPLEPPPEPLPPECFKVLALVGGGADDPTPGPPEGWDLCIRMGSSDAWEPAEPYRLWLPVADIDALFAAAEIRARSAQFEAVELAIADSDANSTLDATVVICTHKAIGPLRDSVLSVVRQATDGERFEIILVNNKPDDANLEAEIATLRQIADGECPDLLRVVRCPIPGLSHARNAGIAEARGAIIICLDDDAVARKSLVSEAVRLFRERPECGVIGGHIRLVPPDPAPEVLNPGWERYWSQHLTDATECREVQHWWEFPWGACWCARRNLLLTMGGFRSGYGRIGSDYSGGEEIIAASLAQKLGHRVAVAPELEVEHRVERSRYTWRHVRKTIIAGALVTYQAQRDLHLPMWEGIGSTLKKLLSPSFDRTVGANSYSARARHWLYRKEAWMRLLSRQIKDRFRRMRRPSSRKNG